MSNKELRAKIVELAKTLSHTLPTDFEQLSREALEAKLVDLEKAAAPPPPAANQPPAGGDVASSAVAPSGPRYFVPDGKSLSCKRGVLGPGEEVFPTDVTGLLNDVEKPDAARLLEAQNKQIEFLAGRGHLTKRS